jgi:ferric-dicitrate binding protein FerR (iron transport regulator)
VSDGRDKRWPEGAPDDAGQLLADALRDARERVPDDVTMRRMWARVSQHESVANIAKISDLADLTAAQAEGAAQRDDIPWLALEEATTQRARRPRWIWFAGGVATAGALAAALLLWQSPRREVAMSTSTSTLAPKVAPAAEPPAVPATEGTVRTGAGERLHLALAGGAEARLGSSSVLTVARDGAAVDGGEVAFTVIRRADRAKPYVVTAGPYRVVVLGARFRLSLDEARRVRVDAEDGVAEVWSGSSDRVARLAAGESWTSPTEPASAPSPALAPAATSRPRAASVGDADGDPAARAQAALAAGDVPRALALYRAQIKRGGPAGENAAYEVGRLLRDRLGQSSAAVSAWRRYRADHPDGLLRVETDVSIIETLVHAGDTTGALAEANDFLRGHPDSERRAEIARIAGDLYRVRGEFKRAVAAYQLALASPRAREAEPAAFHRAECLVRLGDPSGEEAARDYLRRFPDGRFRADAERLLAGGDDDAASRP